MVNNSGYAIAPSPRAPRAVRRTQVRSQKHGGRAPRRRDRARDPTAEVEGEVAADITRPSRRRRGKCLSL